MTRKRIDKDTRRLVYEKYNGRCAYCGCEIEYKDMQIDHIDSVYKAVYNNKEVDDSVKNYMPSCRQCNFYKSTFGLEDFRSRLETTLVNNLTSTFQFRLAEKYKLVSKVEHPKVRFYFEQI